MTKKPFPLADQQDFNAWKLQNPNAYLLLDTVMFDWRGRSARIRGEAGKWTAQAQEFWSTQSKLSRDQTKRAFHRLELDGLIRRKAGTWNGPTRCTFIQPTELALKFMGRHGDKERLKTPAAPKPAPMKTPVIAPKPAPLDAPFSTSLPSPSSLSTETISHPAPAHAHTGGKGSAGGDGKKKLVLKKKKVEPESPIAPPSDDDDVDAMIAAAKAKKLAQLEKQFPEIAGDHGLKHPSELYPEQWAGFSPEAKANLYAKYKSYVENAQKKQVKGKAGTTKTAKTDSGFYTGKKPGTFSSFFKLK